MKLDVDLGRLWANVKKMGAQERSVDLGSVWNDAEVEFDDQLSSTGIEVSLDELESEEGLLSVRGRQVLLFIPDHGFKFESASLSPAAGNKFHVADCSTLDTMKNRKRFERYKVTNNMSGNFEIFGMSQFNEHVEGEARLHVCKNCLNKLNYKGAANSNKSGRDEIVELFDLEEFFTTYSSLFQRLPSRHISEGLKGYSADWSTISSDVRRKQGYTCQHCEVDLSTDKKLLHVHHLNGEKSDNSAANLIALCADCHRKEPFHGHMFVKHSDTQRINQLRNEQGVYANCDWNSVKRKADPSLLGILNHCEMKGYTAPHVGYRLNSVDSDKSVILELAWTNRKFGVVLNEHVDIDDWRILTLHEALEFFGRPKQRTR